MIDNSKLDLLYKYDKPINWNVSCFGNDELMYDVISYIKYLDKHHIENPIKTVHGSYISKYGGGRPNYYIRNSNDIYDKIREFNDLGIGVKMTFSNPYFTKEWLEEKELNEYLEVLSERKDLENGIICSIDEFADYIHKKYPNLVVTSSYVKMANETRMGKTDTTDYYNKLFDLYDIVVMNTYRAFDDEFLDQIKYKDRIEFIVNNTCNVNCQIAHKHYEAMYEDIQRRKFLYENNLSLNDPKLIIIRDKINKVLDNCNKRRLTNNPNKLKYQQLYRNEINHLLNKGINHFKLEGRDFDLYLFRFYIFRYIFNNESILVMVANKHPFEIEQDWKKHRIL